MGGVKAVQSDGEAREVRKMTVDEIGVWCVHDTNI
jgi:hypothetical protein